MVGRKPEEIPSFDDQTAAMKAELNEFFSPWHEQFMLLRSRVAQDFTTPIRILELLARDPKLIVRHSVAHNPMATSDIAQIAMEPMSPDVVTQEWHGWKELRYVYGKLPVGVLIDLLSYKSLNDFYLARYRPAIIRALPKNTSLPSWVLNELLVSGPTRVHLAIVKRPDIITTEQDWWTLCQAADPQVQQAIQDGPGIPSYVKVFASQAGGKF